MRHLGKLIHPFNYSFIQQRAQKGELIKWSEASEVVTIRGVVWLE